MSKCKLKENGAPGASTIHNSAPRIYTITQIKVLLEKVDVLTFPYVGNVLFAGARSAEADERLWSDFVDGELEHRARESARVTRSCVPRNLLTAFLPYSGCNGAMCLYGGAGSSQRVNEIFRQHDVPLIQDGLRHSFCSYSYRYITSVLERSDAITWLARWMGNTPKDVKRYYLDPAVSADDAVAFFAFLPAFLSKPLPAEFDVAFAEKLHVERTAALNHVHRHALSLVPCSPGDAKLAGDRFEGLVTREPLHFLPTLPAKITLPPDPGVISAFPCFSLPARKRLGSAKKKTIPGVTPAKLEGSDAP